MMNKKCLPLIVLIVTMLLVPLNAFAHDVKSDATKSFCACHLHDFNADGSPQPDHSPCGTTDDSCDCEGCCPEATEPSSFCGLRVTVSVTQLFHLPVNSFFPKVYLTIFVPPQSYSLT